MSWHRVALVVWLCSSPASAGTPDYAAFCDREGRIRTEQQVLAAQAMVRDPEQLEAVYADAVKGNQRAARVFYELETVHFPAIGREIADRVSRPGCLVPLYREFSGSCIPNWAFLDFLRKDTQAGVRLRKALFDAFSTRARERGLENQLIAAQLNAVFGLGVAAAALGKAGLATTTLYRAVSEAEFQQLMRTGRFAVAPNTLEGKFFAETASDAVKWGQKLHGTGHYRVVEVGIPTTTANQLMRWDRLDGIGPGAVRRARSADQGHDPRDSPMIERSARVQWLKPEEGGRSSWPAGPTYSTVARFDALADRWPQEAWSVVLSISAPADPLGVMTAGIRMLAGDEAPAELLSPGSKFELYEGRRCVARGEVL